MKSIIIFFVAMVLSTASIVVNAACSCSASDTVCLEKCGKYTKIKETTNDIFFTYALYKWEVRYDYMRGWGGDVSESMHGWCIECDGFTHPLYLYFFFSLGCK